MRRKNIAVLLAAGKSERMKMSTYKQHLKVKNKYMYEHAIDNFRDVNLVDYIILVIDKEHYEFVKADIMSKYKRVLVCIGGETRKDSLNNAINAVKELFYKELKNINIISHDAARIFINRRIIEENIKSLDNNDVVNTIFPFRDSLVAIQDSKTIDYPNRSLYYQVQTPQSFRLDKYITTNFKKIDSKHEINDVVKMFYLNNVNVHNVIGDRINFKITDQTDLHIAEILLNKWQN